MSYHVKYIEVPETELDYWQKIYGLRMIISWEDHELHRNITSKSGITDEEIEADIKNDNDRVLALVNELKEKFGVIPLAEYPKIEEGQPLPPAPEGKIYFRDWYKKMETIFFSKKYEEIICSVCPFSNGFDRFVLLEMASCSIDVCSSFELDFPWQCNWVTCYKIKQEQLYQMIKEKAGDQALATFKKKEQELGSSNK